MAGSSTRCVCVGWGGGGGGGHLPQMPHPGSAIDTEENVRTFFFPGLDVMPFPTTPSTRGKRAGQELKSGTSKSL